MIDNKVDLLVIGAGATGASVSYEATKRGLKVALLDSGDIGGSTSCRSTKLLHGGVRYLELAFKTLDIAQLRLVREALLERAHWLKEAPFLARRLEIALPSSNLGEQWYHRIGLGLYDLLSGSRNIGSSRLLTNSQLNRALPLLDRRFQTAVAFSDGQFNDARLNLLLALTAERSGAVIRTHCKVVGFEKDSAGHLCGVISEDSLGNQTRWETKVVVNATGTNSDSIRKAVDNNISKRLLISRGAHVVLGSKLCEAGIGLLLPSTDDERILFVLPFLGSTLIGTTDTPCHAQAANTPTNSEISYLIKHLQRWFPSLQSPEIKSCWAGGRPLLIPKRNATNSSRVVREHEIETLSCGLISAMGGKWTTCRPIALDTLKAVENLLKRKLPEPKNISLIGSHLNPYKTPSVLLQQQLLLRQHLPDRPTRDFQIDHLQSNYGLEALEIVKELNPEETEPLSEVIPICKAELQRAIKIEHAQTPTDILARRCRLAMIDKIESERILPLVQEELTKAGLPPGELLLDR